MTDVPAYVTLITAGAGIIGATIPQVAVLIRDARQAERDRRERSATATRAACVALLSASGEVRTLAESIRAYRGNASGMRERMEEMRSLAETTRVHAAEVGMLAPAKLADPADRVAKAASDLVDDIMRNLDPDQGVLVGKLDVGKLVECIAAFRNEAVTYAAH
jgi:hypothetical protein